MKHIFPRHLLTAAALATLTAAHAQQVDFSVVYVPEESGNEFVKITKESDYVCMPTVVRSQRGVNWMTNCILGIAPNGREIAYLSLRNQASNIFITDIDQQGAARQRTNRTAVQDFSYSPDGKSLCFSEAKGKVTQMFITDAHSGYVCRQITSGAQDYSPIYSADMKHIYFTRMEQKGSAAIWAYDINNNYLSSYTIGLNPQPDRDNIHIYVARTSLEGRGEIWRINQRQGTEECIVSDRVHSFYSPQLSPDGRLLLMVGSSKIENGNRSYWNTDLYVCNTDGSNLNQITYHAADDLSPVWSNDGKYIYFVSQRGSDDGSANVWRLTYNK
jgi:Tol biopolymer transport system component